MFDILLNLGSFLLGMSLGKAQATNNDITKQTSYMQDLIDEAYEKRDAMRTEWLAAEAKAESWERRYFNLLSIMDEETDEDED